MRTTVIAAVSLLTALPVLAAGRSDSDLGTHTDHRAGKVHPDSQYHARLSRRHDQIQQMSTST